MKVTAPDGVQLDVQITGDDDAPPVLFLHGVSSSSLTYDWLPPKVTEGRRIVKADFRGHGASGHRANTYTRPYYVDDAKAVLEQAIGRPAVLVGFSLGGIVGWELAQTRPDLLNAVFLEEPPLFPDDVYRNSPIPAVLRATIEQEKDWKARGIDLDQAAEELGRNPAGPGVIMSEMLIPESIRALAASTLVRDRGVTEAAIDATMTLGIDPVAPVHVPTLILAGGKIDSVFSREHEARIAQLHPEVVLHRVAEAGHGVHTSLFGREAYLQLLVNFLDRHAR